MQRAALLALLATMFASCSGASPIPTAHEATPLVVGAGSHVIVLQYEAWFGPDAATFADAEAMPILQSADMRRVGGGYDSADPHVIAKHLEWMEYMGVDAASIDLTNNVGCIFSAGPVSPKFCNPASELFRRSNRIIRDHTGNLYPAWSSIGTRVKLLPLLGCQTALDLRRGPDGRSGFQKEIEYFGRLVRRYPALNVIYAGHPLMLVYVGTPIDLDILRQVRAILRDGGFEARYTFRIVGGFLDSQPAVWNDPSQTPSGPIEIAPRYGFWSYVDRHKTRFALYPTYSVVPGTDRAENLTVSIATPGQRRWGCPKPRLCPEDAPRYGPSGSHYATLERFMPIALALKPTFLILHQFNEFARPDEGWDADTSNDIEPTRMPRGWGYGGIEAARNAIAAYKRAAGDP